MKPIFIRTISDLMGGSLSFYYEPHISIRSFIIERALKKHYKNACFLTFLKPFDILPSRACIFFMPFTGQEYQHIHTL
ncbi:MAG: hypothetical protein AVO38_04695 [delta proteobacterium ML8_D]|nr:MAG: hypothetical protein AVO38_04695 [delta proteobacterium ML8_D]